MATDTISENELHPINVEFNKQIEQPKERLRENEMDGGKALQDSENRYRGLFESAREGILILDAESGMVLQVNPFLVNLLGCSNDGLVGKHVWEIRAFKDLAVSRDDFERLRDKEYVHDDDLHLETSGRGPVSVEFVSTLYQGDHGKVIHCNFRDITVHKQAEEERKRLMAAIEQVAESVVITDVKGNIQYVNPAFERVTGYTREEVVGNNPRILKSGEQDEKFLSLFLGDHLAWKDVVRQSS